MPTIKTRTLKHPWLLALALLAVAALVALGVPLSTHAQEESESETSNENLWEYTGNSLPFTALVIIPSAQSEFTYQDATQTVKSVSTYSGGVAALSGPESALTMKLNSLLSPEDQASLILVVNGTEYRMADAAASHGDSTTKLVWTTDGAVFAKRSSVALAIKEASPQRFIDRAIEVYEQLEEDGQFEPAPPPEQNSPLRELIQEAADSSGSSGSSAVYPYLIGTLGSPDAEGQYRSISTDFNYQDCSYQIGVIHRLPEPHPGLVLFYSDQTECSLDKLYGLILRFDGDDYAFSSETEEGNLYWWLAPDGIPAGFEGLDIMIADPDYPLPDGGITAIDDPVGAFLRWNALGNDLLGYWQYRESNGDDPWGGWKDILQTAGDGDWLHAVVEAEDSSGLQPTKYEIRSRVTLTESGGDKDYTTAAYGPVDLADDDFPKTLDGTIAISATAGEALSYPLPLVEGGNPPYSYGFESDIHGLEIQPTGYHHQVELVGAPRDSLAPTRTKIEVADVDGDLAYYQIDITVAPNQPADLLVVTSGTGATLTWNSGNDAGITHWYLQQKTQNIGQETPWPEEWTDITPGPGNETEYQHVIPHLPAPGEGQSYRWRLRAAVAGPDQATPIFGEPALTSEFRPNQPPVIIKPIGLARPVKENGPIPDDMVFTVYDPDQPEGTAHVWAIDGETADLFAIDNGRLTVAEGKNLDYEMASTHRLDITVTDAYNAFAKTQVDLDIEDVAEPPGKIDAVSIGSEEITHNSLILSWGEAPNLGGPAIVGYDVRYCEGSGCDAEGSDPDWLILEGATLEPKRSLHIVDLKPETTYSFQVRADNGEGEAEWSDSHVATTEPAIFDGEVPDFTFVLNQRLQPERNGMPKANKDEGTFAYAITPNLPAGLTFDAEKRFFLGTPEALTPAAEYTYTAVDGEDEREETFTIEVIPSPPTNVYAEPQGSPADSILVCWDDPSGGEIKAWQVRRAAFRLDDPSNHLPQSYAWADDGWKSSAPKEDGDANCHYDTNVSTDHGYAYQVRAAIEDREPGIAAQSQAMTTWAVNESLVRFQLKENPISEYGGQTKLTVKTAAPVSETTKFTFDFAPNDDAPYNFGLSPNVITISEGQSEGNTSINVAALNDELEWDNRYVELILTEVSPEGADQNRNPQRLWLWILEDE